MWGVSNCEFTFWGWIQSQEYNWGWIQSQECKEINTISFAKSSYHIKRKNKRVMTLPGEYDTVCMYEFIGSLG